MQYKTNIRNRDANGYQVCDTLQVGFCNIPSSTPHDPAMQWTALIPPCYWGNTQGNGATSSLHRRILAEVPREEPGSAGLTLLPTRGCGLCRGWFHTDSSWKDQFFLRKPLRDLYPTAMGKTTFQWHSVCASLASSSLSAALTGRADGC